MLIILTHAVFYPFRSLSFFTVANNYYSPFPILSTGTITVIIILSNRNWQIRANPINSTFCDFLQFYFLYFGWTDNNYNKVCLIGSMNIANGLARVNLNQSGWKWLLLRSVFDIWDLFLKLSFPFICCRMVVGCLLRRSFILIYYNEWS